MHLGNLSSTLSACFYSSAAPCHHLFCEILSRVSDGNLRKIAVCVIALGLGAILPMVQEALKQGVSPKSSEYFFDL